MDWSTSEGGIVGGTTASHRTWTPGMPISHIAVNRTVFGVARGPVGQRGARGRVRARFQNLTRAELPPGAAVATARSIATPVTDSALINIGPITIFTLCTVRNVWVD